MNRIEKGDVCNPTGRPRNTLRTVLDKLDDKGYTRISMPDIFDAYERTINLPEEELKKVINDKTSPMIVRIIGKALLDKKGFEILEKMLDRAYGKPKLAVDVTSGGESINSHNQLSDEAKDKIRLIYNEEMRTKLISKKT